tara:strand:- start:423 stop:824 length:402 start_codon:yes stop_codon:yes gene_type:complete
VIPLFLFPTKLPLTVDRIEEEYAVVEWKDGSYTNIEKHLLPSSLHEGQALIVYLRPSKEGEATAVSIHPAFLNQAAATIELPYHQHLKLGHQYELIIHPLRNTYVETKYRIKDRTFFKRNMQQDASALYHSKP